MFYLNFTNLGQEFSEEKADLLLLRLWVILG